MLFRSEGWHDARIVPYAPFPLDPATVVFHYAQEIFEGMKAYRTADDTIQPVSYTHLDVYKRQSMKFSKTEQTEANSCGSRGKAKYKDVYKRQELYR